MEGLSKERKKEKTYYQIGRKTNCYDVCSFQPEMPIYEEEEEEEEEEEKTLD
ncbi:MAG: hypothetical protein ACI90V_011399 [Bacillariaceae sp.]|jgi:hypothetical protein